MVERSYKRKLAAIFSADVVGYSRLMGEDEAATVKTLEIYKGVMSDLIRRHQGRVVDSPGDNLLAEFGSVVDGVQCAVAVQKELQARNAELPENRKMQFRIGINLGDVIEEGDRIYGDGLNIAARLEALADPGGICVSKTAFDQIETKLPLGYEFMGEQEVKNIAKPVGAYRVLMEPRVTVAGAKPKTPKVPFWRHKTVVAGAIVVLVAVIGLGVWNFYWRTPKTEVASKDKMAFPLPDKPSIAVLPFVNMSGDPKQEFFSDGITEDIITALSKVKNVFVIARNSTFTYKGKPVKVKRVSEELGVRYVLEGSVQKSGDQVRITAQLIDALSGHHLWAERYERKLKDLFAIQDEVTLKILMAMQVKLTEGEHSGIEKYFKGKQGLECYLKVYEVLYYIQLASIEGNNTARRIAKEIMARCPENPYGYLFMGWSYWGELFSGSTKFPRESLEKAMEMAHKALAMDDSNPDAHGLLSVIYCQRREYEKGIAEGERAVALDPNGTFANEHYGQSLFHAGRFKEAIPILQKTIRLNPLGSSNSFSSMGFIYTMTGQPEKAVSAFKQANLRSPDFLPVHVGLAYNYIALGREKDAWAEAAEVRRINPKFTLDNYSKGIASYFPDQSSLDSFISQLRKAGLK